MNVNEAIRIMRARAPVVTCANSTAALWRLGKVRYKWIESVTLLVNDKGQFRIYVDCRDSQALNSRTRLELDDIELAPDCSETLRRIIYKGNKNA